METLLKNGAMKVGASRVARFTQVEISVHWLQPDTPMARTRCFKVLGTQRVFEGE